MDIQLKICIYSTITNNYDVLQEDNIDMPGIDFIMFTDDKKLKSTQWNIVYKKELAGPYKQSRLFKIKPYEAAELSPYDISLWIDGRMRIASDITEFITRNIKNKVFVCDHPVKKKQDLYDEIEACKKINKDVHRTLDRQERAYRSNGYPAGYGLWSGGQILRQHFNNDVITIGNEWWKQYMQHSRRDQISLSYASWKTGIKIGYFDESSRLYIEKKTHK